MCLVSMGLGKNSLSSQFGTHIPITSEMLFSIEFHKISIIAGLKRAYAAKAAEENNEEEDDDDDDDQSDYDNEVLDSDEDELNENESYLENLKEHIDNNAGQWNITASIEVSAALASSSGTIILARCITNMPSSMELTSYF